MTNLINITSSADKAEKKPAVETSTQVFIEANIAVLSEGLSLLRELDDGNYNGDCRPAFQSTIGAHFRHLLEHYQCFLKSIEQGTVCYDSRARDAALELNRGYAIEVMELVIAQFSRFRVDISSPARPATAIFINDQQSPAPVQTTLQRELLFLQSHSVHHYAMIAAMLRLQGVEVGPNFGVAIATQIFEASKRCSTTAKQCNKSRGRD